MNIAIDINPLAEENLKTLPADGKNGFEDFLKNGAEAANGERIQGLERDIFMVRLGRDSRLLYRLFDHGKKLEVLNVFVRNSVFDRS